MKRRTIILQNASFYTCRQSINILHDTKVDFQSTLNLKELRIIVEIRND